MSAFNLIKCDFKFFLKLLKNQKILIKIHILSIFCVFFVILNNFLNFYQ